MFTGIMRIIKSVVISLKAVRVSHPCFFSLKKIVISRKCLYLLFFPCKYQYQSQYQTFFTSQDVRQFVIFLDSTKLKIVQHFSNDAFQSYYDLFQVNSLVQS